MAGTRDGQRAGGGSRRAMPRPRYRGRAPGPENPPPMGQATAAGLRAGLASANVPVWLNSPLVSLNVSGGRVTGVVISHNGSPGLVTAARGVVVGSGGFEHNASMRAQYQQQPIGTRSKRGCTGETGAGTCT